MNSIKKCYGRLDFLKNSFEYVLFIGIHLFIIFLFLWEFLFPSRIFHSYGAVATTVHFLPMLGTHCHRAVFSSVAHPL